MSNNRMPEDNSGKIPYQTKEEAFSYRNINLAIKDNLVHTFEAYIATQHYQKPFIHILKKLENTYSLFENESDELIKKILQRNYQKKLRKEKKQAMIDKGWKFHISLLDVENNIEKGWDIVKNHLIDAGVQEFKIIFEDVPHDLHEHKQPGKEITIYAFKELRLASNWQTIIQQITDDLVLNNVIPGPLPLGDTSVNGSNYFSFVYDHGREVRRIMSHALQNISANEATNLNTQPLANRFNLQIAIDPLDIIDAKTIVESGGLDELPDENNDSFETIRIYAPNQIPRAAASIMINHQEEDVKNQETDISDVKQSHISNASVFFYKCNEPSEFSQIKNNELAKDDFKESSTESAPHESRKLCCLNNCVIN